MPEEQTPSSYPQQLSAQATVTVRPLRYTDLNGVNAGDEDVVLYRLRDHAGVVTLDRSEITSTASNPVYLRQHRRHADKHDPVGVRRDAAVRTVYGSETNVRLYDTTDAFDADFPPDPEGIAGADKRQQALARQADTGVYIEDPDGPTTLPVTPDWGSQVYLSVLVPGLDPDTLAEAIAKTLDEQFPGHRRVKLRSRWAADRRVNVHRSTRQPVLQDGPSGLPRTPLAASGLLEAEVVGYGPTFPIEQLDPETHSPTART